MPSGDTATAKFDRRLAAVVAVDVVAYSRHMNLDEEWTHARYKADRSDVIDPSIAKHKGRIVKSTGDGFLAEFASAVEAVRCMIDVQAAIAVRNSERPPDERMEFRVGINLGDVIIEQDDIYGDGVNVAARLEAIATPGGICISGKIHDEIIGKMDLIYEDMGPQQLKNIEQPVRIYHIVGPGGAEAAPPTARPALALPDRPSIAVLPFFNLSRDPTQDYFSDGITEDITTELSRFSDLLVIARNSSFQYKERAVDVRQVGRDLGVHYVLEGSVRRHRGTVRVSAQLVDAVSGMHRWAERYDRKLTDALAVQGEVAKGIVAVLAVQVKKAERERSLIKPPSAWQAYDYYLRAAESEAAYHSTSDKESLFAAHRLLNQALAIDPNYARARAALASIYMSLWIHRWNGDCDWSAALDRSYQCARESVQLAPDLPEGHIALGQALTFMRQHEAAISAVERAIALNPNLTSFRFSYIMVLAGNAERAVELLEMHMRLDPFYQPNAAVALGFAHYMLRRYAAAIPHLQEAASRAPNMAHCRYVLAMTYAQLGEVDKAKEQVAHALRLEPWYTISNSLTARYFRQQRDKDHLIDGLRKAGFPE